MDRCISRYDRGSLFSASNELPIAEPNLVSAGQYCAATLAVHETAIEVVALGGLQCLHSGAQLLASGSPGTSTTWTSTAWTSTALTSATWTSTTWTSKLQVKRYADHEALVCDSPVRVDYGP
jgi:hypothetical protein